MGCGGVEDVSTVAGSNSVAVPHLGKKSRRGAFEHQCNDIVMPGLGRASLHIVKTH